MSRISLSGVQTKHSVKLNGRKLELTDRDGEFILKPVPNESFERVADVPANEHVTMQMARQLFGMNTAANALVFFSDGEPAYLTRRFDRDGSGLKFLQEDFAQLSRKTEASHGKGYKYDGSYEEMAGTMREFVGPYAIEVEKLFACILFNYLVLNGDAHLKNFSLFRDPRRSIHIMTPAYDMLNTRLHLPDEVGDTALQLFMGDFATDSFTANAYYALDDFILFGDRIGMKSARVLRVVDAFASAFEPIKAMVERSFLGPESKTEYIELVRERIKRFKYSYKASSARPVSKKKPRPAR
ncbi:MAG TPA: HipA domain-containing protein [Fibrobacteria bacterium]|nr:HipA domain-containing protein [Fibrobacteria bacterium]